jgi:hypothetical protein
VLHSNNIRQRSAPRARFNGGRAEKSIRDPDKAKAAATLRPQIVKTLQAGRQLA